MIVFMGEIHQVQWVKPICAVTYNKQIALDSILPQLELICGKQEEQSAVIDFSFTNYYSEEMGDDLLKVYVVFQGLIHPNQLPEIKLQTNVLEQRWVKDKGRQVNLDPGYLSSAKMVLASTKDYSHRLYLSDGIYGDVQMICSGGSYQTLGWTYPDYKDEKVLTFFNKIRKQYIRQKEEYDFKNEL